MRVKMLELIEEVQKEKALYLKQIEEMNNLSPDCYSIANLDLITIF